MLYSFSLIILFILGLITPKTKEKESLIVNIVLMLIIILAYNTMVCYILNFLNIPITLQNLAIVNSIISCVLLGSIAKQKQIQRFKINIKDIIACLTILIIAIITIGINTSFFTKIHYLGMDPLQHYKAVREFCENETLSNKYSEQYTTSKSHMPMGYVNIGILFKIFKPLVGYVPLCRMYLVFEALIFGLTGILFYFCVKKYCKTKNQYIITLIFTVIYTIGYPLNSVISGFHYLTIGILYFTTIIYIFENVIEKQKLRLCYNIILLTLLNTGLIFSYALFCPPVYLAELIYFLYKYKNNKNKKSLFLYIVFPLLLTGAMGSMLILYENIKNLGQTGIKLDGWIYKNDWSNFILFIPFSFYYIVNIVKEKNKEKFFEKTLFAFFIIFYIMFIIGRKIGICSNYYSYKNSFILWIIVLYTAVVGMQRLIEKGNVKIYIVNVFTVFYCFYLMFAMFYIKTYIVIDGKDKESVATLMDVFSLNVTSITTDYEFLSKEDLDIINELDKHFSGKLQLHSEDVLIIGNPTQEQWINALTGYRNSLYNDMAECIINWNKGDYEYLVILNKTEIFKKLEKIIDKNNVELIYKNEGGKIYQRIR